MLKSDPRARHGAILVKELEDRIDKLKQKFDIYFSGVDNINPTDKKVPIRRIISKLNEMQPKNPAIRFKFQSLVGRFVSLNQYWTRTMREIEEGRLQRSLFRSRSGATKGKTKAYFGSSAPVLEASSTTKTSDTMKSESVVVTEKDRSIRHNIKVQEISEKDLRPSRKRNSAEKITRVVDAFEKAQQDMGISAKPIKRDVLERTLAKQTETLKKKYAGAEIDFKVVKKGDKVVLKPVVKRKKVTE